MFLTWIKKIRKVFQPVTKPSQQRSNLLSSISLAPSTLYHFAEKTVYQNEQISQETKDKLKDKLFHQINGPRPA